MIFDNSSENEAGDGATRMRVIGGMERSTSQHHILYMYGIDLRNDGKHYYTIIK